jgi:serine/threonine-protein kinase
MTGDVLGTLRYMSPEQALAKHGLVDHRTDVYSLGVTLYELLTGTPAVRGKDREEILNAITLDEPRPPRRLDSAIPHDLETIVLKAMEKNPTDRYATAQELAEDLHRYLRDESIRAKRPSLVQRARKWARRRRGLVAAGIACLLVALLVLGGSIGWVTSDLAARRSATEVAVTQALDESVDGQAQRRLPEALAAARHAAGLVAEGEADNSLRRRVQSRVEDLEWLDELEKARLEIASDKNEQVDPGPADSSYAEIFGAREIVPGGLSTEEATDRIHRSTVTAELAATLDHWAVMRRLARGVSDTSWKQLLQVARAADEDRFRNQVREAIADANAKKLVELVGVDEVSRLLPATLSAVARVLQDTAVEGQAEELLRAAQRQHPNDFWTTFDLAEYLSRSHPPRLEEAIRYFTAAVAIRPHSPAAHNSLANVLHDKGHIEEATIEHLEAIRLAPHYVPAHIGLGNDYYEKKRLDLAITKYRDAISLNKNSAYAHNNLGLALRSQGHLTEAIEEYRTAIQINANYAEAHNNLGYALYEDHRSKEAITEFRKAVTLKPGFFEAQANLAAMLGEMDNVDEAIIELRKAIELKKMPQLYLNLGRLLIRQGQFREP